MTNSGSQGSLKRQAILFAATGAGLIGALYPQAKGWWSDPHALRWLVLSLVGHLYFTMVLFRNLHTNRRKPGDDVLAAIGWANALTLLRAALMATVVGFLFSPRPEGAAAWLPGLLYTAASLPDYIDGIVARKTNHVTGLGEILDMNVDSVGVFTATFLAFQYGVMPWWYVPIGLARYIFVGGIELRRRAGLPVTELSYSHRRRGFAALKMGFMFVMLFPLFTPPGTFIAAAAFGLPFLAGFLWDWFVVTGALTSDRVDRIKARTTGMLKIAPSLLRLICVALALPYAFRHLSDPGLVLLGYAELAVTILIGLGIAPRATAIAAVCLIGVNQNLGPLAFDQYVLAVAYIETIFLGTGSYSLFPVEDYLIYNRIGDPA